MAQRNPLQILVVGTAGATKHKALGVLITAAVAGFGSLTERRVINESEKVSEIIKQNKLVDFKSDASGMLLFNPKREEKRISHSSERPVTHIALHRFEKARK